jgi:uncharacterized membrane protein YhhN
MYLALIASLFASGEKIMLIWLPIPVLVITLALLLRAEEKVPRDERRVKLWKPTTTALVILVCLLSWTRPSGDYDSLYTSLILVGLCLSMAGDVLLIFQANPRAFLAGLVAFLCAHLVYIAAFVYLQISQGWGVNASAEMISLIGLVIVGAVVYLYLAPGLAKMRQPVIFYMAAISTMVHRALAVAWVHPGPLAQPVLIVAGAVLFYLSDAILAINKFRFDGNLPWCAAC